MTFEEFADWLRTECWEGRLTLIQAADVLAQRRLFDDNRAMLEAEFPHRTVGYIANQLHTAGSVGTLLDVATARSEPRMLYFESIGSRER